MRLQLLRLVYGVMLGALLVTPFGVYHSRSEPYITGSLWGYHLPIGYVGLLLGLLVVLYPRLNTLRSLKLSSLMIFIGLFLLLSFLFFPKDYFINLLHGTSFSPGQIDVDFPVGNSAVLGLSLLSIIFGLIPVFTRYPKKEATDQSEKLKPVNPKRYLSRVRGWLPEKPYLPSSQGETNSKTLKARTLGAIDSHWTKSKTFRLAALVIFFLFLIASAIVVLYVFRPYPFLIFVTSIVIGIIAYWRRPRKQARYSENSSQR